MNSSVYYVCLIAMLVAMLATSQQNTQVLARYLNPSARSYGPAVYSNDYQPRGDNSLRMMRRQDDGDADEESELDDQNAAASYRNQDDDSNNQAADGYDDNEADGPYEETPVEREGQADLERFFDDHLGASDREGMDKENLPTNLVASIAEPSVGVAASDQHQTQIPPLGGTTTDWPRVSPIVKTSDRFSQGSIEQPPSERAALVTVPTFLETSITRLPDERKLIVTNQITRSRIVGPILSDKGNSNDNDNNNNNYSYNDDDDDSGESNDANGNGNGNGNGLDDGHRDYRLRSKSLSPLLDGPASVLTRSSNNETRGRQVVREQQQQMQRLLSPPLSTAANQAAGRQVEMQRQPALAATTPRDANNDNLSAISSEVVAIEDEDYDRVYVTNATHKPFRIDALGGYDPEADFRDAARDLEIVSGSPAASQQQGRRQTLEPSKRPGSAQDDNLDSGDGDDDGDDEDGDNDQASSNNTGERSRSKASTEATLQPSESADMYEGASETDEVTFGQDDPYQTDLEAEMRQQSYDKVGNFKGDPSTSNESNAAAAAATATNELGDPLDSYRDVDPEIENDYKAGGSMSHLRGGNRRGDNSDEEGSWVNDGVDEMDIPSQAHQNYVLDKAAKHDAMKRRAAEKEAQEEAEAAKDENQVADEEPSREDASGDGEVSQRMPNADYLKNDYSDDDSAYAA